MNIARNQRVTNDSLLVGQTAMNLTRAALLANGDHSSSRSVSVAATTRCETTEQPLDFSVKPASSSPSPSLSITNPHPAVRTARSSAISAAANSKQQNGTSNNFRLPVGSPVKVDAIVQAPISKADRAVESLLMLSQSAAPSMSSRSSLNPTESSDHPQTNASRNRRKPASGNIQRRSSSSASPLTCPQQQTNGLLVVSQGDTASSDWQSSSSLHLVPSSSSIAGDEHKQPGSIQSHAIASSNNNLSISSASQSSASFSPSSNGGSSAFNLNLKLKLITDEGVDNDDNNNNNSNGNNRRYRHRQSSSSQHHQPASIPPDSTTASMDGDEGDLDEERIKVRTANGVVNRRRPRAFPDEKKDDSYWERRRKNNEAAKRSRDARRQKEDDVVSHANQLENENKRLREEISELRAIVEQLRAEVMARQQQEHQVTTDEQSEQEMANGRSNENSENCAPVVEPMLPGHGGASSSDSHSPPGGMENNNGSTSNSNSINEESSNST